MKIYLLLISTLLLFSCGGNQENHYEDNLVYMKGNYSKDDSIVYYLGEEIIGSDPTTFELLGNGYSKDKNNVYTSFRHTGSIYSIYAAASSTSGTVILEKENPNEFVVIDKYFAKGNLRAYNFGEVIEGSHGPTFESLGGDTSTNEEDRIGGAYGKDAYHIYYSGLNNVSLRKADVSTFEVIKFPYAVDKNYVFYAGRSISKADYSSFEILTSEVSKDKNNVYLRGSAVREIDAPTYSFFPESNFAKDKNSVYYSTEKIEEADLESFVAKKGSPYARDKNNYYNGYWKGVMVDGNTGYEEAVELYK